MNLEARLTVAHAFEKRAFILSVLMPMTSAMTPTEKVAMAEMMIAVKSKQNESFIANLSGLVVTLTQRGLLQLDKFVYDVSEYRSFKVHLKGYIKQAMLLMMQGFFFWLFSLVS